MTRPWKWDFKDWELQNYSMCVGSITMMTLFVLAFAISGGLYLGTIVFSAFQAAEFDKAIDLFDKAGIINLA